MKTTSRDVISKSNMKNVHRIKMSFADSPEAMAHMARMVTDIYADQASACIREYAANGLDSSILAGQSRPIEVTLPTIARPELMIQDWGVGMSKMDIIDVYSKYGASTKRDSNDFIGSFGLGCKAGLSMSPSFAVVAIKDGEKTVALVHRGEDGMGDIEFVHESLTDLPNGVTIKIAVSDGINDYKAKAKAIFVTWPKGSVLVDGVEPELSIGSDDDFITLGNSAYLSRRGTTDNVTRWNIPRNGSMIVNMGGIGYLVDHKQMDILIALIKESDFAPSMSEFIRQFKTAIRNNLTLVLNVDMASVDLISSRESLRWSGNSTRTVVGKIKEAINALPVALSDDFKDCKTRLDVLSKDVQDFASSFRSVYNSVEWNGDKLPSNIPFALTRTDNYYDTDIENFIIRYNANSERIPALLNATDSGFSFGFENNRPRSFGSPTADSSTWVFVEVESGEEVKEKVSKFANTFVADLKAENDTAWNSQINIVAHIGDIFENKWLKAVVDGHSNMMVVTLDTLIERSKSRRRITAAEKKSDRVAAGPRGELTYPVYVISENNVMSENEMTPAKIDKMHTDEGYTVYLDNNQYIRTDGYYHAVKIAGLSPMMKPKSIVVGMKAGRKFEALQTRISSPVGNFENDLAEEMNAFIKTITLKDYLSANSPYRLTASGTVPEALNKGFLKDVLNENAQPTAVHKKLSVVSGSKKFLSEENANWDKDFQKKKQEIMDTCILYFSGSMDYRTDSKKYNKAMAGYLNGLSTQIEKIVK